MTTIAILPDNRGAEKTTYRAVAGSIQSEGKTAGEALDALTAQLGEEAGTLIIVQNQRPDQFFSAQQQQRLGAS